MSTTLMKESALVNEPTDRSQVVETGMDPEALDRVVTSVESDIDSSLHHGAVVLVARRGQVVLRRGIGLSDLEAGRAAEPDDIFLLMSTAKSFTAALVLRLIDRAELSFDTRVSDIIPEFGVRGKERVTVRQLLTHTGGTWAGFVPPPPVPWGPLWGDMDAMTAAVSAQQIAHRPGAHVIYNPFASYNILGEIVRRLDSAKRSFRDIAKQELFDPLGMNDTSFGLRRDAPRRVPLRMAETTPGAAEVNVMESLNDLVDENFELPAGMAFGTADDLFTFAETIRNKGVSGGHRLLSQAMVSYAYQNHTGDMTNEFWDFNKEARGIAEFPANFSVGGGYVRGIGHFMTPLGQLASPSAFGSVGSGSTMWMVDPERELTFVFLSSGLLEGLHHFQRLQRVSDLVIASVVD
ncbi:serine hydrolase domain-containing protein [Herbiconiux sp. UC225_62]|uniref:serine hydrolase domain-containing protein n=1 Tax=Herbiconiux sp. UC225_62 TaxID=3350168 RepID=UPI0036D3DE3B